MFKSLFKTSLSPFPAQSNPLAITKNLLTPCAPCLVPLFSAPLSCLVSLLSAPLSRLCLTFVCTLVSPLSVHRCLAFVCAKALQPQEAAADGHPRKSRTLILPSRASGACQDQLRSHSPSHSSGLVIPPPAMALFCHLLFTQLYRLSSSPLQNAAELQYFHRPRSSSE